ncbi:hypothetical protein EPC71_08065, partial [Helicobacter pylori]
KAFIPNTKDIWDFCLGGFKKDDCIDALASAITHESVKAPIKREVKTLTSARFHTKPTWRI